MCKKSLLLHNQHSEFEDLNKTKANASWKSLRAELGKLNTIFDKIQNGELAN